MSLTTAYIAAAHFFDLAKWASQNGGIFISASGGTANVVAGTIALATGINYTAAHEALDAVGRDLVGDDWYYELAVDQPWPWLDMDAAENARWEARTIARCACRRSGCRRVINTLN